MEEAVRNIVGVGVSLFLIAALVFSLVHLTKTKARPRSGEGE